MPKERSEKQNTTRGDRGRPSFRRMHDMIDRPLDQVLGEGQWGRLRRGAGQSMTHAEWVKMMRGNKK